MNVELIDGKYNWVFDEKTGTLVCLRNGFEWRDETGDGAVLALVQETVRLQNSLKSLCDGLEIENYDKLKNEPEDVFKTVGERFTSVINTLQIHNTSFALQLNNTK